MKLVSSIKFLPVAVAAAALAFMIVSPSQQAQAQEKGKAQEKAKGKGKGAAAPRFKTVTVATGLNHPWSLAWLPNGDMLITERPGRLRLVHDGVLDPTRINGVPKVHAVRLSGLMEVLPHPNFAQN